MRVLVELLDKEPIENIMGAFIFKPQLVIFLGDSRDSSLLQEQAVVSMLRRRSLKTQARFYYFNSSDPTEIRRVLTAVARDYPDCVFDFSGGRDLVLAVAGSVCHALNIPSYYIDMPAGRFIDIQHCRHYAQDFALPCLTVEDVFALTGAKVEGSGHFLPGELNPEFEEDVLRIWPIVQRNPRAWSSFVGYLQACSSGRSTSALRVSAPAVLRGQHSARANPQIFHQLRQLDVFTEYRAEGNQVYFTYKSSLHKKCLLNQGVWLELFCYVTARRGGGFDDVRTSVVVDWASARGKSGATRNEVDVVLVRGVVPVFISCKMSAPTPLALSEIRLLAAKFGGSLSRTVVLTATRLGTSYQALQTRAADLDILLLDRDSLEKGELASQLQYAALGYSTLNSP